MKTKMNIASDHNNSMGQTKYLKHPSELIFIQYSFSTFGFNYFSITSKNRFVQLLVSLQGNFGGSVTKKYPNSVNDVGGVKQLRRCCYKAHHKCTIILRSGDC